MKALKQIVFLGTLLLTACASLPEVNIDPSKFNGGGQNIFTTTHTKEKQFSFFTKEDQATQAAVSAIASIPILGVLGAGLAGGTAGAIGEAAKESRLGFKIDQFSKTNNIHDPKFVIEKTIVVELAKKYNLIYSGSAETAIDAGASLEEIISKNTNYPYLLDVTTKHWALNEREADKFSMKYSATLSLIETANKVVLAQGLCSYESQTGVIDLQKLKINDISEFNNEIALAVASCVKQFSEKNLSLKLASKLDATR